MSLLLDALRKKEQEMKDAAKRVEETTGFHQDADTTGAMEKTISEGTGDISAEQSINRLDRTLNRSRDDLLTATSKLSLEPIDEMRRQAEAAASETQPVESSPSRPEAAAMDEDGEITQQVKIPVATAAKGEPFKLEMTSEHLVIDHDSEEGADSPLDESFEEDMQLISDEIPGLYDETIQGEKFVPSAEHERSYDETLPGIPAAELAKDLGEEFQPTPVAAQTVFMASASRRSGKGLNWPLLGSLAVIVIIAFGIVAYYLVTPSVVDIPSQQLAADLTLLRQSAQEVAPPAQDTAAVVDGTAAAAADSQETLPVVDSGAAATAAVEPPEEANSGVIVVDTINPVIDETAATVGEQQVDAGDDQQSPPQPEPAVADSDVIEPGLLRISRSSSPDPRGQVLKDAYTAYKQGDYDKAQTDYLEVLKLYPDNRDALLGLGAIAMKLGNMTEVYRVYSHLYRINPKDRVARAVLVNLDSQTDPINRESTLKIMINDSPEEAFLHFSLGNIYATQSRWAEAQQAFFDAYRFDATNPDYALNLAVSLDHLGQTRAALDYYNTALKLADEFSSGFDSAVILARIQTLNDTTVN